MREKFVIVDNIRDRWQDDNNIVLRFIGFNDILSIYSVDKIMAAQISPNESFFCNVLHSSYNFIVVIFTTRSLIARSNSYCSSLVWGDSNEDCDGSWVINHQHGVSIEGIPSKVWKLTKQSAYTLWADSGFLFVFIFETKR